MPLGRGRWEGSVGARVDVGLVVIQDAMTRSVIEPMWASFMIPFFLGQERAGLKIYGFVFR